MALPFRLTAWGWGRLIGFASVAAVTGVHSIGQKVGLIEDDTNVAAPATPAEQQSLADRDAEVKRIIAARAAQAKAVRDADGQGY
jgi:hypothetical protein